MKVSSSLKRADVRLKIVCRRAADLHDVCFCRSSALANIVRAQTRVKAEEKKKQTARLAFHEHRKHRQARKIAIEAPQKIAFCAEIVSH